MAAPLNWEKRASMTRSTVPAVCAELVGEMRAAGCTDRELFGLRLSLESALLQCFQEQPDASIELICRVSASELELLLEGRQVYRADRQRWAG